MELLMFLIWPMIKIYLVVGVVFAFFLFTAEFYLSDKTTFNFKDFIVLSLIWPFCLKYFLTDDDS
jgi:hypothetical protein